MIVLLLSAAVISAEWLQPLSANVCAIGRPDFDFFTKFDMQNVFSEEKMVHADRSFEYHAPLESLCASSGLAYQSAFGWPNNTLPSWLIADGLHLRGPPPAACEASTLYQDIILVVRDRRGKTLRQYLLPLLSVDPSITTIRALANSLELFILLVAGACLLILCVCETKPSRRYKFRCRWA